MEQFVEVHKLKRLQEESSDLNRPVSSTKIESAMRNLPREAQDKVTSLVSSVQQKGKNQYFPSQALAGEGRTLPNSLMRPALPQRKRQELHNFRLIPL